MKKQILCLALLVLMCLAMMPVQAVTTVTMANPFDMTERDIAVYYYNGTMVGLFNSTSTLSLTNDLSYIFSIKPTNANPLTDPVAFLNSGFLFVQTNAIPLFVLAVIAALYFRRK